MSLHDYDKILNDPKLMINILLRIANRKRDYFIALLPFFSLTLLKNRSAMCHKPWNFKGLPRRHLIPRVNFERLYYVSSGE